MREITLAVALLCGCQAATEPPLHGKPTAAVDVRLDATSRGGGDYDVTLTATPAVATGALELVLDGQKRHEGAVAAGEARRWTVRVHAPRGREVFGGAAVGQGNRRRSKAAAITVGAPAAPAARPGTIITLPDGSEVAEVR